jgi:hypothetical protein
MVLWFFSLRLFFDVILWLRTIVFPLLLLALEFSQIFNDFFAIIKIEFCLIFLSMRSTIGVSIRIPMILFGWLIGQGRKIFILLGRILYAMFGLSDVSSIGEGMSETMYLALSLDLVEPYLLVEHISVQLLLLHLFSPDVLVFAQSIHFIE